MRVAFFAQHGAIAALGVGCFGPLDLRPGSPTWGHITTTPKPGWSDTDVAGTLPRRSACPSRSTPTSTPRRSPSTAGAARPASARSATSPWEPGSAAAGSSTASSCTASSIPSSATCACRTTASCDPFAGACPYHGDCLEGLASGSAILARWGIPAEELTDDAAWRLEADYLALGIVNVTAVLSPERVVIGGGVMAQPLLLPLIRERVGSLLGGYFGAPVLSGDLAGYIVAPSLGARAGVLGALELARMAVAGS